MAADTVVDDFITRWRGADGSELANAQSFTRELCELLGVSVPDPAQADTRDNAYVFERRVIFNNPDGTPRRRCRSSMATAPVTSPVPT